MVPLGTLPLGLAMAPETPPPQPGGRPAVLLPHRGVAAGLRSALQGMGLGLRTAGSTCQGPEQWIEQLERSPLAMPLLRLEPARWWRALQRLPLPTALEVPLWLVLPDGWQHQQVLIHTTEQLRFSAGRTARGPV
jgi:hypothetical protein